jgi:hypothetical protein
MCIRMASHARRAVSRRMPFSPRTHKLPCAAYALMAMARCGSVSRRRNEQRRRYGAAAPRFSRLRETKRNRHSAEVKVSLRCSGDRFRKRNPLKSLILRRHRQQYCSSLSNLREPYLSIFSPRSPDSFNRSVKKAGAVLFHPWSSRVHREISATHRGRPPRAGSIEAERLLHT